MIHVKYREDFSQIPDESLREWLMRENPYIPERGDDSGFIPDAHGWLIVVDQGDSVASLGCGVEAIDNLLTIDYWEFVTHSPTHDLWLAVVILGNGFGMAVAVPDSVIQDSPLRQTFQDLAF